MAKRRPEIINALHEFGRLGQGNRRRNSCYAFMPLSGELNLSLIRRHPITAFWAFAESIGGITPATRIVKEGEYVLVEIHLYVPPSGSDLRSVKRRPRRQLAVPVLNEEEHPVPDHEEGLHNPIDI